MAEAPLPTAEAIDIRAHVKRVLGIVDDTALTFIFDQKGRNSAS
jgi:hypothetical protein